MINDKLETKIVYNKPNEKIVGAVVWLHGLGADFNDFVPIVPELKLSQAIKFVFPNAPVIPVTINNGYRMRAWYDILNFSNLHREVDGASIMANVVKINQIIAELIADGIPENKIIIAGFSQGGALSYYTALNSHYNLGGLLVLSGYIPDESLFDVVNLQHIANMPILVCHGNQDPVVSISYAQQATQYLQAFKLNYVWKEYYMEHSVCHEEIVDIGQWMSKVFTK